MQKYYSLEQKDKKAELYIFGSITSYPWREKDKDAYGIVKELSKLDADEIQVHINSTGGAVSEGLAIYNVLKNSNAKITTYCDGFACSAASVVFMAGDRRIMNEASLLMIHNAWTYGGGNAAEFRKQADDLDKITQASVKTYLRRINISEEKLKQMMDDETWMDAEESVKYGFATETYEEETEVASQSAMRIIKEKLTAKKCAGTLLEVEGIDADSIAEKVVEKIKPLMEKAKREKETKEDSAGFGAFFNTKKGV